MSDIVLVPMTEAEARACVAEINRGYDTLRARVLELHDRDGWKALGYDSWRACVVAEFEQSQRHLYRQLEAAKIEREICPIGQIGSIPEGTLRPLGKVKEPEKRREAWERAKAEAPNGKPTAKQVAAAVETVEPRTIAVKVNVERIERPPIAIKSTAKDGPEQWARRWSDFWDQLLQFLVSMPRRGGFVQLTRQWSKGDQLAAVERLRRLRDLCDQCINEYKGKRKSPKAVVPATTGRGNVFEVEDPTSATKVAIHIYRYFKEWSFIDEVIRELQKLAPKANADADAEAWERLWANAKPTIKAWFDSLPEMERGSFIDEMQDYCMSLIRQCPGFVNRKGEEL